MVYLMYLSPNNAKNRKSSDYATLLWLYSAVPLVHFDACTIIQYPTHSQLSYHIVDGIMQMRNIAFEQV